jgi:hypothetical protein
MESMVLKVVPSFFTTWHLGLFRLHLSPARAVQHVHFGASQQPEIAAAAFGSRLGGSPSPNAFQYKKMSNYHWDRFVWVKYDRSLT